MVIWTATAWSAWRWWCGGRAVGVVVFDKCITGEVSIARQREAVCVAHRTAEVQVAHNSRKHKAETDVRENVCTCRVGQRHADEADLAERDQEETHMKHMASGREILMDTRAKESTLDAIRRIIERDECEIDDAIRTYVEKRRWDGVETDFDEIAGYINEIIGAEV